MAELSAPITDAMIDRIGDEVEDVVGLVARAWRSSQAGDTQAAFELYCEADAHISEGTIGPALSVLRHNVGIAEGKITSIPPTENRVVSFIMMETAIESADDWGMRDPVIDPDAVERGVRAVVERFEGSVHRQNIKTHLPHVSVLSTGRCGTVSLFWLLQNSNCVPYHTYWWSLPPSSRWEMMCRLLSGGFEDQGIAGLWASTRAAEWLNAMSQGRPMVNLNHQDAVFAPVFASLHPQSKFVYLRRDEAAIFRSFLGKNQWGENQLRPMRYSLTPEFRFRRVEFNISMLMAWYLRFTEVLARALGSVVGPERYIEVSADRLFDCDEEEIGRLLEFVGADIPLEHGLAHFTTKFNEKAHKARLTLDQMDVSLRDFTVELERLRNTGAQR